MDRLKRIVVLARLIEALRREDSWCGETHIQKSMYFLQELAKADTDFEFILYKHGPFSFDLRDQLSEMRALGLLKLEFPTPGYGPSIIPDEDRITPICDRFPKTLRRINDRIAFVADRLGAKSVRELERLATALYVSRNSPDALDPPATAAKICKLKPHITLPDAEEAVHTVKTWKQEAMERFDSAD